MEFNFSPSLDSDVQKELEARESAVVNTEPGWMYKKYAYFSMTSVEAKEDINSEAANYLPVFAFVPDGGYTIGTTNQDGYLNAFFSDSNDIRSFKPLLKSATIKGTGGGNLFDAYISEVDIQFKAFTLGQIKKIEKEFFQLGAKVDIKFGWLNRGGKANKGELRINVYNFGFTMNNDGSYDCKLNGLSDGVLLGGQSASVTKQLSQTEADSLGKDSGAVSSLPQSLLALCYERFGITGGDTTTIKKPIKLGDISESVGSFTFKKSNFEFYMTCLNERSGGTLTEKIYPYISFKSLIDYITQNGDSQFEFMSKHTEIKVPSVKVGNDTLDTSAFGSADPRKYILPGPLATYSDPLDSDSIGKKLSGRKSEIQEILISIWTIGYFYDKLYGKTNSKQTPPRTSDLIKALSDDISRLTGGLVDIQIVPDVEDSGNKKIKGDKFKIFNNNEVQKITPADPTYEFKVMGPGSIVKNVSIDTDFDVDTMLATTVGRVKEGEFNIKPLKGLTTSLPDVPTDNVKSKLAKLKESKTSIKDSGIDDTTAVNLADSMRKALTGDESDDSTFVTLPYNLKLAVTIDGINGLGFLQPIKVDRLPSNYKAAGTRFLIIGIEHSFDGQGGWETSIDSAMKVGK